MQRSEIAQALRALPHFRMLDEAAINRLAADTSTRTMRAGEILFSAREPARAFFAVMAGGVKLFRIAPDGHENVVHLLGAGSTFAEAAVLNLRFYPVNAVVTESPTTLLVIPGAPIEAMLREDPRVATAMVSAMAMRMLELVERVEDLSSASAAGRLARYLLKLPSTGTSRQPTVTLGTSKKALAARLAIAPETLSRVLRKWEDAGIVESDTKSVVILDPEVMLRIADGEEHVVKDGKR